MSRKGGMPAKRRRDPEARFEAQRRAREEKRRGREEEQRETSRPEAAGDAAARNDRGRENPP